MKQIILIILFAAFINHAEATTISTPAQSATYNITIALEAYTQKHNGALPSNWKDLDQFLLEREIKTPRETYEHSYFFRSLEQSLGMPVEAAFFLVESLGQTSVEMAQANPNEIFNGGTIVAVITRIISEDRRSGYGRYVIWQDSTNNVHMSWLDESVAETQFKKAKRNLPGSLWRQPPTREDGVFYFIGLVLILVFSAGILVFKLLRR